MAPGPGGSQYPDIPPNAAMRVLLNVDWSFVAIQVFQGGSSTDQPAASMGFAPANTNPGRPQ